MSFVRKILTNKISFLRSNWHIPEKSSNSAPVNVLFMPFMGAKKKHLTPYLNLYEEFYRTKDRHVNILLVQAHYFDVSSSSRGKEFSNSIVNAMDTHLSSKVLVHAMSVGNFMHTSCSYFHPDASYQDKIVGQIYDSPVFSGDMKSGGFENIVDAMAEMLLLKSKMNNFVVDRLAKELSWLACRSCADHWDELARNWEEKSISAPILTFYSTKDTFTNTKVYEDLITEWKTKQNNVTSINFETSDHVKHLIKHPVMFKNNFFKFLSDLEM